MINKGIKSPILLGKHGCRLNGNFYVSLSKRETSEIKYSIYNQLLYLPMFIINDEIKTRNNPKLSHVARISAYLSKLKLSLKK